MPAHPPAVRPRPSRPRLREARFEDHAQISALEAKFDLLPKSFPEWVHLWTENPAYRGLHGEFPIGWVLETGDGAIVGYIGNIPRQYEFQGRKLLAAVTRAWVVDVAYRSYALSLFAAYFGQRSVDLFPNTSVNDVAARAYNTLFAGGPAPVGAWDQSLFWITAYRGFSESFLRRKVRRIARPLSYPLAPAVFLFDKLKTRSFSAKPSTVSAVPCQGFDERFDGFWAALREKKCHKLLAVRSREALAWHFKFALLQNSAWIYAIENNHALAAYAIFYRRDGPRGLTRMRLADFQCLEDEHAPHLLAAMLQSALHRCRCESFHMLEVIGFQQRLAKALELFPPHCRPLPSWRYFCKAKDPELAAQLKNPEAWDPWLYDGDSSL